MGLIEITVNLPCTFKETGGWVLASCPDLDIHSQGRDAEAAKRALTEALELFVVTCLERGTLEQAISGAL